MNPIGGQRVSIENLQDYLTRNGLPETIEMLHATAPQSFGTSETEAFDKMKLILRILDILSFVLSRRRWHRVEPRADRSRQFLPLGFHLNCDNSYAIEPSFRASFYRKFRVPERYCPA